LTCERRSIGSARNVRRSSSDCPRYVAKWRVCPRTVAPRIQIATSPLGWVYAVGRAGRFRDNGQFDFQSCGQHRCGQRWSLTLEARPETNAGCLGRFLQAFSLTHFLHQSIRASWALGVMRRQERFSLFPSRFAGFTRWHGREVQFNLNILLPVAPEIHVLLASPLVRAFNHRSRLGLSVDSTFRLRVGIELGRANGEVEGSHPRPFGCEVAAHFYQRHVFRGPPIIPDGGFSPVRFEVLAFLP
jgi:hypothetical protein